MSDRETGLGLNLAGTFAKAAIIGGACALALTPAACVVNSIQSAAEFNGVQAQIPMLVEQGKMTNRDGTPKPHIVHYKGQDFAISVGSALLTQNGQFRDSGGQVTQSSQTQNGDGAIRSQSYSSGYVIQGAINRVKGSDSFFRPFYNDGGNRAFSLEWNGAKPSLAPLSNQPTMGVQSQMQPAAPNPATLPPQLPASPAPSGPAG